MSNSTGIGSIMNDDKESSVKSFDIFSEPELESDMISFKNIKIKPTTGGSSSTGPIEFLITSLGSEYTLMPSTRLEGACRVVKKTGVDLAGSEDVSVVNMFPSSLFKQIECSVNGTEVVDQSVGAHPFKAYMETLLSYGREAKNTHLLTECFIKDRSGSEDADQKSDAAGKTGYMDRNELIKGSNIVHFSTQLHIDFFNTKKLLPPSMNLKIRLIRNEDSFSLIAKTGAYKIEIIPDSLCLNIRKIFPSTYILRKHEQLFKSGKNAIYPFQQARLTTHLVTSGTQHVGLQNVCTGPLPSQMFVVQVDHDAFNGALDKNPFHFKNNGMNSFRFLINGESHPAEIFKPDFANDDFMREYRNLLDCIGIAFNNTGVDITPKEFKTGSCIMAYDSCPDICAGMRTHLPKNGTINIEMDYKSPTTKAITILVYQIYDRIVEINGADKSCTLKYLT